MAEKDVLSHSAIKEHSRKSTGDSTPLIPVPGVEVKVEASQPPHDRMPDIPARPPAPPKETLNGTKSCASDSGICHSFSQLIAGAMASPRSAPFIAVPINAVRLPVVAVPCIVAPADLLDSQSLTGQLCMTHQALLATVTAQAQMQLQTGYFSPSITLTNSTQQMLPPKNPTLLQEKLGTAPEETACAPKTEKTPSSDQNPQSIRFIVKTSSDDGYNWRKYGQKQVKCKSTDRL